MCSRREADRYIEQGLVYVDGQKIAELGTKVSPDAEIELAEAGLKQQSKQVTILINKPIGFVSGQPEDGYKAAVSLIAEKTHWRDDQSKRTFNFGQLKGIAPAGRLDIDSNGLLVLTQDGRVARQIIGEDSSVDKEYLVRVKGNLSDKGLRLLNHGLELDGKPLKPAKVTWQNRDQLKFILREGKKRQIRRMCDLVGLKVVGLKRIRIGKVVLGNLPNGEWRYLGDHESF
jgi:23S rRNA pseudouridine2604 synthase